MDRYSLSVCLEGGEMYKLWVVAVCLALGPSVINGQTQPGDTSQNGSSQPGGGNPGVTTEDPIAAGIKKNIETNKQIKEALKSDGDQDFALVIGIGSKISASGATHYSNEANVLHS